MTLGLMQPYLFPYLGYFQLMRHVDTYVFYENVQYMRQGWVNRNRLYTNIKKNETHYFTFAVVKDDYKKEINERYYSNLKADCEKLRRILYQSYKNASNFEEAYTVIDQALQFENNNVAYFNMNANYLIARYMGIDTQITCMERIKDKGFWDNYYRLDYESKVIYICRFFQGQRYVNAIGGASLYHKKAFLHNNIELKFIKMDDIVYPQFEGEFTPNLSIIDVIMHNKIDSIKLLLDRYQIIE